MKSEIFCNLSLLTHKLCQLPQIFPHSNTPSSQLQLRRSSKIRNERIFRILPVIRASMPAKFNLIFRPSLVKPPLSIGKKPLLNYRSNFKFSTAVPPQLLRLRHVRLTSLFLRLVRGNSLTASKSLLIWKYGPNEPGP